MSLRVWLPLNGDLKNQGLEDVTVTNDGTIVNNDGKIGKCYTNNTDGNGIILTNYMSSLKTYTTYSMAAWIYMNYTASGHSTSILSSGNWNNTNAICCFALYDYSDGYTKLLVPNKERWNSAYITLSSKIVLNKWYHIAITYNGTETNGYINGEYIGSVSSGGICTNSETTNLKIGAATYYNGFTLKGKYNDIRIYDHCLSSAEVKEISRGLVLHYKLNHLPINNLIPFNLSNDTYTIMDYANRTTGSISNKIYHVDGYQSETLADTSFSIKSNTFLILNTDSDYYLSFYCKAANSISTLYFGVSGQAYTGLMDSSNKHFYPSSQVTLGNNYEGYVVLKIHTGSDTQYKINIGFDGPNLFGIGSYMEFSNIMLTSSEPDLESTYFDNTILDLSGYNNGTITGELSLNSESPRYKNSTIFNGSSYIQTISPSSEVKSISLWAKWNSIPSGQSVVFVDYKSKIGLGLMSTGILCSTHNLNTKTFNKSNIVANTWYHFVIVNPDDVNRDLYINGVKQTPTTNTSCWTYTLDYFQLGKRSTTSDGFNGEISDFRMYSTILSEEDIRQLYEVSGKIDNFGNLHSYKFEEYNIGRELLVVKRFCYPYYTISGNWNNFSNEGMEFNSSINSAGTEYIEINPEGHEYIYDFTISISDGNQFYIGFERYDENKTARSNNACTYVYYNKPGSDLVKRRYTGTVNLSTDGVNPCKYIRLRILNGWSGSDSDSTKLATVHRLSLREIPTSTDTKTKLLKQGVLKTDMLREGNTKTKIEKNLVTYVNEFIEI